MEKEKNTTEKQLKKEKKVFYIVKKTRTLSRIVVIASRGKDVR